MSKPKPIKVDVRLKAQGAGGHNTEVGEGRDTVRGMTAASIADQMGASDPGGLADRIADLERRMANPQVSAECNGDGTITVTVTI